MVGARWESFLKKVLWKPGGFQDKLKEIKKIMLKTERKKPFVLWDNSSYSCCPQNLPVYVDEHEKGKQWHVCNFTYTACLVDKIIWSIEYKGNIKQLSWMLKSLCVGGIN